MKQIVMLNFVLVLIKHFDNGFINVLLKYLESIKLLRKETIKLKNSKYFILSF